MTATRLKIVLRRMVLAALVAAAMVSVCQGIRNGWNPPWDLQWGPTKTLLAGSNPYGGKDAGDSFACYPPSCLLLLSPLAAVGHVMAGRTWLVCNFVFMATFVFLLCILYIPKDRRKTAFGLVILFLGMSLPFRQLLECGQHSGFSLMFFALALVCRRRGWRFLAGICLIPALFKYTLTMPLALVFVLWKEWKPLAVAAAGHLALTLVGSALTGIAPWTLVLDSMVIGNANCGEGICDLGSLAQVFGITRFTIAAYVGYAVGVALLAWATMRANKDDELTMLSLLSLISLFMSYHRLYDCIALLIPAVALLVRTNLPKVCIGVLLAWFIVGFRLFVAIAPLPFAILISVALSFVSIVVSLFKMER